MRPEDLSVLVRKHEAVLEMRLRHFACLSKGDIIAINYNNKIYELNVLETKVKEDQYYLHFSLKSSFPASCSSFYY